jgi:hypothetical protein
MAKESFWQKINRISARPLYLILIAVIIFPFLVPFQIPMSISDYTRDAYLYVESLPPGSIILAPSTIEASCWGECGYSWVITWEHFFRKGLRVVTVHLYKDGPLLAEKVIEILKSRGVKIEYGVNYVNLGFVAGLNSAIAAMVEPPDGMHRVFSTDYFGNPIKTLPLMNEVKSIEQIDLISSYTSGFGEDWVGLAVMPYKKKYIYSCIGVMQSTLVNEYQLGFAVGGLAGLKGGAEYELLMQQPGAAVKSMNAISTTHILTIVFIIIGNIAMIMTRKERR